MVNFQKANTPKLQKSKLNNDIRVIYFFLVMQVTGSWNKYLQRRELGKTLLYSQIIIILICYIIN
jgi:hypothetical protein